MTTQRRTFLKAAGIGAAAMSVGQRPSRAAESRQLVVGVIGTGGMGTQHVRALATRQDVDLAYLCDADQNRLAGAVKHVEEARGKAPKTVKDLRQILDDASVDAVFIATPDHWHAPASILALDAGKHVYVEKPCCHNIREGGLMVEAVRRSGKLLQVGTQSRSTACVAEAIRRVHAGEIGEVLVAKAWNSQRRGSIGKTQPSDPPAHLDYDLWLGPAPEVPFRANMLPAIWRWWYDFGCGDIGNDGVHDIDVALWGLNPGVHPTTAACLGGKYFFDDDQQFPDTQYAVFEYPQDGSSGKKKQLIFEQRIWSPYAQEGYSNGAALYGEEGMLLIGHTSGWRLYGPRNKLLAEQIGRCDLPAHHQNFFDCIRGDQKRLNADVTSGHRAATVVHLANIAARMGRALQFDPQTEKIVNDAEANALVAREYRDGHWAVPRA
ncbi:MAG: Gfo/Idh/MocA family oxidoreductase [Rhodopirellula sp.]|nr:Gfo/Idh/MocA family oxidoreductase [Rhodopirellula sp.]